jgi:2-hydroxychromene-2-carboxylate isomerase
VARLQFWYEFASTYSYLSAMRIEAAAAARGVIVEWRPFLLGPIFKAQGWNTTPFNLYPAKGRYMVRDMERLAAARGLSFRLPDPFPQNSLKAARWASAGLGQPWLPAFTRAVYLAEFAEGRAIDDASLLNSIATGLGLDPHEISRASDSDEVKSALRRATEDAQARGLFGAPAFVTDDDEVFWGDDRLDQALEWAAEHSTK